MEIAFALTVIFSGVLGFSFAMLYNINKEIKEAERLLKRNNEVYLFRCMLLYKNKRLFDQLPDYRTMVESKKPLEEEYWIKIISN